MNREEYNEVKWLDYYEYCDYLQEKYGIGLADYMTPAYNPNPKCKRTKDGLLCHHKYESEEIALSYPENAKRNPFEWQKKENIVYCDYLEHLLLHVKIATMMDNWGSSLGIGGISLISAELNDLYSGWRTEARNQLWRMNCFSKVADDEDVYLSILEQLISEKYGDKQFEVKSLLGSLGARYGSWELNNNKELYQKIQELAEKEEQKRERLIQKNKARQKKSKK